jgi:hypothetical protein
MISSSAHREGEAAMTSRRLWIPLLVGLLAFALISGSSPLAVGADDPTSQQSAAVRTITGGSIMEAHGTAWVPELRARFARWRPVGWGTQAKVKAAGVGDQWVHIPIPVAPWLADTTTFVFSVHFCAQSTNGSQTRPVQIDVWSGSTRIYTGAVYWWSDNATHCWNVDFSPTLVTSVGVSVLLHFATTTDQITLEEAAVSFAP